MSEASGGLHETACGIEATEMRFVVDMDPFAPSLVGFPDCFRNHTVADPLALVVRGDGNIK
jgi:hypothetical protein